MLGRSILVACALAAALGALASGALLELHLSAGGDWSSRLCGGDACREALASPWAYLPPLPAGTPAMPWHVPVAGIGLGYFVLLATWLALVATPLARGRWIHAAPLALAATGAAASLALASVMAAQHERWCPLCSLVHVCNAALVTGLVVERVRARRGSPEDSRPPSARLALAGLGLAGALAASIWLALANRALQAERAAHQALRASLERNAGLVELFYLSDERFARDAGARARFDRGLRPDDPARGPGTAVGRDPSRGGDPGTCAVLVYFADAECEACAWFERYLESTVSRTFAGHLRVVYKHFPLRGAHPQADAAARALEAARLQGRFWELHAALGARRGSLAGLDYAALARQRGLDADRFARDMESAEVRARVDEDLAFGRMLGVESTPSVFLDRRRVDESIRGLSGFWELRAEALRRERAQQGQPW